MCLPPLAGGAAADAMSPAIAPRHCHSSPQTRRLSDPAFAAWEDALSLLPKYAVAAGQGELRAWLQRLPSFPLEALLLPGSSGSKSSSSSSSSSSISGSSELWRAYLLLSFLAHGYMWCDGPGVPQLLPARLAAPWCAVAAALDMPPVLTYR